MRRENVIRAKIESYSKQIADIADTWTTKDAADRVNSATMYQRAVINALRWVLCELKDV